VPAHADIQGNEIVDELAMAATENQRTMVSSTLNFRKQEADEAVLHH
jgi:hypothetical protein